MNNIKLEDINADCKYEGYFWLSDENNPIVFTGEKYLNEECVNHKSGNQLINPLLSKNPFIIEGQLFDRRNKISFSIKYIDGEYMISKFTLSDSEIQSSDSSDKQSYLSKRMDGRKLCFIQRWKEEKDALCEGFPVLQPEDFVFVGFKKDKED